MKNFLLSNGIEGVDENANIKQLYYERLKSKELSRALHELFIFDDDPAAAQPNLPSSK